MSEVLEVLCSSSLWIRGVDLSGVAYLEVLAPAGASWSRALRGRFEELYMD